MQHHNRQAHLRLAPHTNNIQIHPAPVPMLPGQPPTQHQKQQPHMNVTTPQTAGMSTTTTQQSSTSQSMPNASNANMRDPQLSRSNHPKHMPATQMQHNQTAQMQKIRQQHQHVNHKINAVGNINGINNNANQAQYPNHMNVQRHQQQGHMSNLQQQPQIMQRNVPNTHQHNNTLPNKNHVPAEALTLILPANNGRQTATTTSSQQQQYNYNYTGNKPKFNNNNNNNNNNATKSSTTFSTPRAILQNPNRITTKSTTTTPQTTTNVVKANEKVVNNEASCSKDKSEDFESNGSVAVSPTSTPDSDNSNEASQSSKQNSPKKVVASNSDDNKENQSETSNTNDCNQNKNSKILCNNDDSISKNCKEKTPMCLVNELARYNKITHQYRLTNENGPAHSKRFTVTLKLGNEEYTADGFKIKKAQHAAAALALEQTAYKHPIPKAIRNHDDSRPRPYIMPTVELNALAMKLGQQTYYLFDPRQMPTPQRATDMHDNSIPTHHHHHPHHPHNHHYGGGGGVGGPRPTMQPPTHNGNHMMPLPPQLPQTRMIPDVTPYGQRRSHFDGSYCATALPPPPPPSLLTACPAQRPYGGGGGSSGGINAGGPHQRNGYPMMQRYQRYPLLPPPATVPPGMPPHLQHYGMPVTPYKITLIVGKQKFVGTGRTLQHAKHDAASRALQVLKNQTTDEQQKEDLDDSMDENDIKSPISQVHEAGIKRNVSVHFKIIREEGPAHMRNFITACIMGSMVTEGEGHGKKISKKRAAEKMLLEIKKLPPINTPIKTPTKRLKTKTPSKHESKKNAVDAAEASTGKREKREKRGKREKGEKIEKIEKAEKADKGEKIEKVEKNFAKEKVIESDDETPVTRLLQLLQSRKQKEPVFEYIAKHSSENIRKREHIFEVSALGRVARGTGINKKLAKQKAAENLLQILLEVENENSDSADEQDASPTIIEPSTKQTTTKEKTPPKIPNTPKLIDPLDIPIVSTSAGQVPGILILRPNKKQPPKKKESTTTTTSNTIEASTPSRPVKAIAKRIDVDATNSTPSQAPTPEIVKPTKTETLQIQQTTTTTTTEPTETSVSTTLSTNTTSSTSTTTTATAAPPSNDKPATTTTTSSTSSSGSSSAATSLMKHQLLYLAKLLGFEVNFSDFPKGNHNEFLTIVSLSTDPPQMCHGFGPSTDESQNDAARNALKILSDLGLNNAKSN